MREQFRLALMNQRIGNKSGHLAILMKQYTRGSVSAKTDEDSMIDKSVEGREHPEIPSRTNAGLSRRGVKKQEQDEVRKILEEEGITEEIDGEAADELEKLCASPLPEDILLYAVPMCGPYSAFRDFKFRVKLTPGTVKKGKAAKQAADIFQKQPITTDKEKCLLKTLSDPEMVAIMIGDCKLSMPGLQQIQRMNNKKIQAKNMKPRVDLNELEIQMLTSNLKKKGGLKSKK